MNGFGLHIIPMVGSIFLSWLGLRSLGVERGAPLAAPGWPSGCTLPEVEHALDHWQYQFLSWRVGALALILDGQVVSRVRGTSCTASVWAWCPAHR